MIFINILIPKKINIKKLKNSTLKSFSKFILALPMNSKDLIIIQHRRGIKPKILNIVREAVKVILFSYNYLGGCL